MLPGVRRPCEDTGLPASCRFRGAGSAPGRSPLTVRDGLPGFHLRVIRVSKEGHQFLVDESAHLPGLLPRDVYELIRIFGIVEQCDAWSTVRRELHHERMGVGAHPPMPPLGHAMGCLHVQLGRGPPAVTAEEYRSATRSLDSGGDVLGEAHELEERGARGGPASGGGMVR